MVCFPLFFLVFLFCLFCVLFFRVCVCVFCCLSSFCPGVCFFCVLLFVLCFLLSFCSSFLFPCFFSFGAFVGFVHEAVCPKLLGPPQLGALLRQERSATHGMIPTLPFALLIHPSKGVFFFFAGGCGDERRMESYERETPGLLFVFLSGCPVIQHELPPFVFPHHFTVRPLLEVAPVISLSLVQKEGS